MLRLLLTDDSGRAGDTPLGTVTITNAPTGGDPFQGHYDVTLFSPIGDFLEQAQLSAPRGHGPWALATAALQALEEARHTPRHQFIDRLQRAGEDEGHTREDKETPV
jgi:hypothetical protein